MLKLSVVGLAILAMVPLAFNIAQAQTASSGQGRENAMQKAMREACEDDPKSCKRWRQKARERREAQRAEQLADNPPGAGEQLNKTPVTSDAVK